MNGVVASVHAIYSSQDIEGEELENLVTSLKWFSLPQRLLYQIVGPEITEAFHRAVNLHSIDFLGYDLYALVRCLVLMPCVLLLFFLVGIVSPAAMFIYSSKGNLSKVSKQA